MFLAFLLSIKIKPIIKNIIAAAPIKGLNPTAIIFINNKIPISIGFIFLLTPLSVTPSEKIEVS